MQQLLYLTNTITQTDLSVCVVYNHAVVLVFLILLTNKIVVE